MRKKKGKDRIEIRREDDGTLVMTGESAFIMFATYGFPIELTVEVCADSGAKVDVAGFYACMEEHKRISREKGDVRT